MNKIGIYYAFWEKEWNADYCFYIEKAKKLGFDILEIAAGALVDMSREEQLLIANTARKNNITLTYCIGLPPEYDVASTNQVIRQSGIRFVGKILDAMHYMGGHTLGGIIYSCWPLNIAATYDYKMAARERALCSVKEIAKKAEEYNIDYCLEIVNRFEQCILNCAAEGVEFVKEVGSPKVKLLLDTFHMNIEEDNIGNAIRSVKGCLGHFHIGESNRKTPGNGHMPWNEIMKALKDINYDGGIVMEPFIKMGGQVGNDIKVFRDLSDNADEAQMDILAKDALEFIKSKGMNA